MNKEEFLSCMKTLRDLLASGKHDEAMKYVEDRIDENEVKKASKES